MIKTLVTKKDLLKDRLLFLYKSKYGLTTKDERIITNMCNGVLDYAEQWDDGIYIMRIDTDREMWKIYSKIRSL